MKRKTIFLALLCGLPSGASATNPPPQYIYNVGPNVVNMAGSSCRGRDENTERTFNVVRSAGSLFVFQDSGTFDAFCPFQRRNTTVYNTKIGQVFVPPNPHDNVTVSTTEIIVDVANPDSTQPLSCFAYQINMPSQSLSVGTQKFLCATAGGCTSYTNSTVPSNTLNLPPPSPNPALTANFGYFCYLASGSGINWGQAKITPNI